MAEQHYCLRWNNHQKNFITIFKHLLDFEELVDVTISVEGKQIKAHKVILSACSPYFKLLFSITPSKHPVVILNDIKYKDMKTIIDFIYCGEVSVSDEELADILEVAETLQVRGLYDPKQNNLSSENEIENASKKVKKRSENNIPPIDKTAVQDRHYTTNSNPSPWSVQQLYDSESVNSYNAAINDNDSLLQDYKSNLEMDFTTPPTTDHSSPYVQNSVPNSLSGRRRHCKVQESENFLLALEAVRTGKLGFCKAAKLYGLNNRTLWLEYKKRGYPTTRPPVRKVIHKQNTGVRGVVN